MDELQRALDRLSTYRPRTSDTTGGLRAATALILTREPDPHFAVIRRAEHPRDPWSGHAALPGGRIDPLDADARATARRETREEVGIELGEPVGALDDITGRMMKGAVTPVVFQIDAQVPFTPDPAEVAGAHWVPLALLSDPAARTRTPHRRLGPWPGWEFATGLPAPHDSLVIWGLTHTILQNFLAFVRAD